MKQTREEQADRRKDEVIIPCDVVNEQVVIAAALADDDARAELVLRFKAVHFAAEDHKIIWGAIEECERRKLRPDPATLQQLYVGKIDPSYVVALVEARPTRPGNLEYHCQALLWDHARVQAAAGPVAELLHALKDPRADPMRVRALGRSVSEAFDGYQDRSHLSDPATLVREQVERIRARREQPIFPFGIEGLDYSPDGKPILVPGAQPGMVSVVTGVSGSGKALALDTPVATPDGWSSMGELREGDFVFGANGHPVRVVACSDVLVGRPCYEVEFSDGSTIVADAEHLWKTLDFRDRYTLTRRTPLFRSARSSKRRKGPDSRPRVSATLLERGEQVRRKFDSQGTVRTTRQIRESLWAGEHRNHAVRVAKPLELPHVELPVDPYVLGVWLGDGDSDCGRITSADEQVIENVRRAGWEVSKGASKYRWCIRGLAARLRHLGVLRNKRIPDEYLRSSVAQRLGLLRGLMDTDGSCAKNGTCNFVTTSSALAFGVWELLSSLGIKARPCQRFAVLNGITIGMAWQFVFCSEFEVFGLERKRVRQAKPSRGVHAFRYVVDVRPVESVPVRCIQVDAADGMFLASKQMVPTHNSPLIANMVLGLAEQGRRVLYGSWEVKGGMTLEWMALLRLGLNRAEFQLGKFTEEDLDLVREEMERLAEWVTFMPNPFGRMRGERRRKGGNEERLDVLHGYITDSGCDTFVADLFERCLATTEVEEEKFALFRMQSIADEMRIHAILATQQRLKDIEQRPDKRPTREGIKGTSVWVEVADNIFGTNRPALWRPVPDDVLEVHILKQRVGRWPILVEFDWDPERYSIVRGREVPYSFTAEGDEEGGVFAPPRPKGGRGGFGRSRAMR